MTTYTRGYVISVITSVAIANGLDPTIALATAYHESGFNPFAVGDNGTSFGIFQLHEGGELPSGKNGAWASNPVHNANVAIPIIASQRRKSPDASPGAVAALAQRPADQAGYAVAVNGIYETIRTRGVGALPGPSRFTGKISGSSFIGDTADAVGAIVGAGVNATNGGLFGSASWLMEHLGLPSLASIFKLLLAAGLFLVGMLLLFHDQVSVASKLASKAAVLA